MRAFVNLQISQLRNEIESKQSQIAELKDEGQKVTLAFQQLQREHGKLKEEETEKSKKLQVGGGRLGTFCFKIKSPFHLGGKAMFRNRWKHSETNCVKAFRFLQQMNESRIANYFFTFQLPYFPKFPPNKITFFHLSRSSSP